MSKHKHEYDVNVELLIYHSTSKNFYLILSIS